MRTQRPISTIITLFNCTVRRTPITTHRITIIACLTHDYPVSTNYYTTLTTSNKSSHTVARTSGIVKVQRSIASQTNRRIKSISTGTTDNSAKFSDSNQSSIANTRSKVRTQVRIRVTQDTVRIVLTYSTISNSEIALYTRRTIQIITVITFIANERRTTKLTTLNQITA